MLIFDTATCVIFTDISASFLALVLLIHFKLTNHLRWLTLRAGAIKAKWGPNLETKFFRKKMA